MTARLPLLSVVVPVRDDAATLDNALSAIAASDLARSLFEVIVVDDASEDDSVRIAARHADTVVRLGAGASGPAYARNRGAELAQAQVIVFVDADVEVAPTTLSAMLDSLTGSPQLGAISASWDSAPLAENVCSQYWNLLLHFSSESRERNLGFFNVGCGAVRRSALAAAGMFDEWRFAERGLEGLELGLRIGRAGFEVRQSPDIRVAAMKRWDLRAILAEIWQRGSMLSRSLGYRRTFADAPGEVMFTFGRPAAQVAATAGVLLLSAAFTPNVRAAALWAIAVLLVLAANVRLHHFYFRSRGLAFAVTVAPLHLLGELVAASALCTGWLLRDAIGDPRPDAATEAYSEVGLERWPPIRRRL